MSLKNLIKNEDAVSITVGFILTVSITVLVFSGIIIAFYALSQQSEKAAAISSLDILGSGVAVRITTMDTLVNISNSYGGSPCLCVNSLEYDFSIPASVSHEGYSVNITNSTKQVILESDSGVESWNPYNTSSSFAGTVIDSNSQDYKFAYDKTNNIIIIKRQ